MPLKLYRRKRDELKQQDNWDGWMLLHDIEQMVLATGLKHKDLSEAIDKYSRLAVILLGKNDSHIAFPEDLEH